MALDILENNFHSFVGTVFISSRIQNLKNKVIFKNFTLKNAFRKFFNNMSQRHF